MDTEREYVHRKTYYTKSGIKSYVHTFTKPRGTKRVYLTAKEKEMIMTDMIDLYKLDRNISAVKIREALLPKYPLLTLWKTRSILGFIRINPACQA